MDFFNPQNKMVEIFMDFNWKWGNKNIRPLHSIGRISWHSCFWAEFIYLHTPCYGATIRAGSFIALCKFWFCFTSSIIPGLNYVRTCLAQSTRNRFTNFMSIDWLPLEETRRFPHNVYTEQCWTRTVKGKLLDSKVDMDSLYDIFTMYKDNSRVLAEGN